MFATTEAPSQAPLPASGRTPVACALAYLRRAAEQQVRTILLRARTARAARCLDRNNMRSRREKERGGVVRRHTQPCGASYEAPPQSTQSTRLVVARERGPWRVRVHYRTRALSQPPSDAAVGASCCSARRRRACTTGPEGRQPPYEPRQPPPAVGARPRAAASWCATPLCAPAAAGSRAAGGRAGRLARNAPALCRCDAGRAVSAR